ncbi:MAG: hypothetical protein IAE94_10285 [Chthoniobacterales bacterium]|nr:hypothetical protein [Chthoniobacterales bacterium]
MESHGCDVENLDFDAISSHDRVMEIGRHRPAHHPSVERHNKPVIVLVTVCTKHRRPLLANRAMFEGLWQIWTDKSIAWRAGRFVLMPDHLHVFCSPGDFQGRPVKDWVGYWKRLASAAAGESLWQDSFWDRQLRNHEHYGQRWQYVLNNPVRAKLVKTSEEWPWQGEINVLHW